MINYHLITIKNMIGIYKITCLKNFKYYIGSSINLDRRKKQHFQSLLNNKHANIKLQRSYNKYGVENFRFDIIELLETSKNLLKREQFYIDTTKPYFNICKIAGNSLGVIRREKTKEKLRQANLGLKHPNWRNKIKSEAQGGNKHWTKKKKFSTNSKTKMSNSQKNLYKNGYKSPACKKINQFTTEDVFVKTWESAKEVEKHLNISTSSVSQVLTGKNKTAGGFKWKYYE